MATVSSVALLGLGAWLLLQVGKRPPRT
jgi:hypothetical protein